MTLMNASPKHLKTSIFHLIYRQGHPAEVFRKKGVPQRTFSWLGNFLLLVASAGKY